MGKIVTTLTDLTAATNPPVGSYIVAFDLDGILKKKDSTGTITIIGGGSGVDVIDKTRVQMVALKNGSTLEKGQIYHITDRDIWIDALDVNKVSPGGFYLSRNVDYQNVGGLFIGVWTSVLDPNIGDLTAWNGFHFQSITGSPTATSPDLNPGDWTQLPKTHVSYIQELYVCEYDFDNDHLQSVKDKRGNSISMSYLLKTNQALAYNVIDVFQWGNNNVFGNVAIESEIHNLNNRGNFDSNILEPTAFIRDNDTSSFPSTLSSNKLGFGASIESNDLSTGGTIEGNTLGVASSIVGNTTTQSSGISENYLDKNCKIDGNQLNSTGNVTVINDNILLGNEAYITDNELGDGCRITNNKLGDESYIETNILTGLNGRISQNTLDALAYIASNELTGSGASIDLNYLGSQSFMEVNIFEGSISANFLATECSISQNELEGTSSQIYGNNLSAGSYIDSNTGTGNFCRIISNTLLTVSAIEGNVLETWAVIQRNTLSQDATMSGNELYIGTSPVNCAKLINNKIGSGSSIESNLITTNGEISYNEFGAENAITSNEPGSSCRISHNVTGASVELDSNTLLIGCNIEENMFDSFCQVIGNQLENGDEIRGNKCSPHSQISGNTFSTNGRIILNELGPNSKINSLTLDNAAFFSKNHLGVSSTAEGTTLGISSKFENNTLRSEVAIDGLGLDNGVEFLKCIVGVDIAYQLSSNQEDKRAENGFSNFEVTIDLDVDLSLGDLTIINDYFHAGVLILTGTNPSYSINKIIGLDSILGIVEFRLLSTDVSFVIVDPTTGVTDEIIAPAFPVSVNLTGDGVAFLRYYNGFNRITNYTNYI